MMPGSSLLRGTRTCASRSSCARSARAHSPGWTPRSPSTPPGSSSPRWTPSTTSHCRPPGVTGSGKVPPSRGSATMPDLAEVLADHLAHLRLLGRSERTVYDRERAVIRLAAWLQTRESYKNEQPDSVVEVLVQAPGFPEVAPPGTSGRETTLNTAHGGAAGSRSPARADGAAREVNRPEPDLLSATPADLAAWRTSLTVGDQAVAVSCARGAGSHACAAPRGTRPDTPAAGLPVPSPPRGIPRPVSEEDLAAALACASERVRPWLVLAGWAGFRAKEVALLQRSSVLDTAVPPMLLVASNATKGRRERVVPMSAFVLAELRAAGLPSHGWMFPRRDGKPGPCTPSLISGLAGRCFREAGSAATLQLAPHRL